MFAESMILHARTEAQSEQRKLDQAQEDVMENKQQQGQSGQQVGATQSQQQQMQQQAPATATKTEREVPPGANPAAWPFVDPLGRPMRQSSPRFTDQQAGGDLTGDESDARDDNYVETGHSQSFRDVSAHAEKLPPVSAELLRSMAIVPAADATTRPPISEQHVAAMPEPDGTEDPGANADDGLVPRKKDGTGGEQH